MADPSRDTAEKTNRRSNGATPRWVWVTGAIVGVLALLFVLVMLSGGDHGPGQHAPTEHQEQETDPDNPPPGFDHDDPEDLDPDELEDYFRDLHG